MVCTNDINQITCQGLAQSITIFLGLDSRITLDACTEFFIIFIAEEEMGNTSYGGDVLFVDRLVFKQFQFLGCADVHDMQTCSSFLSQLNGEG